MGGVIRNLLLQGEVRLRGGERAVAAQHHAAAVGIIAAAAARSGEAAAERGGHMLVVELVHLAVGIEVAGFERPAGLAGVAEAVAEHDHVLPQGKRRQSRNQGGGEFAFHVFFLCGCLFYLWPLVGGEVILTGFTGFDNQRMPGKCFYVVEKWVEAAASQNGGWCYPMQFLGCLHG